MDYKLIKSVKKIADLNVAVTAELKKGYQLHGSPGAITSQGGIEYFQAVVKYSNPNETSTDV